MDWGFELKYTLDKKELIKRLKKEIKEELDKANKMEALNNWKQVFDDILWDLVEEKK